VEPNFEKEGSSSADEYINESCEDILIDTVEEEKSTDDFSSHLQNNEFHLPVVVENEPILNPKSIFQQQQSRFQMPTSSSGSLRGKYRRLAPKNPTVLVKTSTFFLEKVVNVSNSSHIKKPVSQKKVRIKYV